MRYFWKVWKWENGSKSVEYTRYLCVPIFIEPHLDETLGTGEIVLDSMPIETRQAFEPKTKMRIERYLTSDFSDTPQKYDFVVDSDQVELYAGCPNLCCHRIQLIEPSVIAQGMHVDNIALTYELQDVSLEYKTQQSSDETVIFEVNSMVGGGFPYQRDKLKRGRNNYFRNSYRYFWEESEELDIIKNLLKDRDARRNYTYTFNAPKCVCQGTFAEGWKNITQIQLMAKVIKKHFKMLSLISETVIINKKIDAEPLYNNISNSTWTTDNFDMGTPPPYKYRKATEIRVFNEVVESKGGFISEDWLKQFDDYTFRGGRIITDRTGEDNLDRKISFTTEILSEEQLENGERLEYQILIEPYRDMLPITYEKLATVTETTNPVTYIANSPGSGNFQMIERNAIFLKATINIKNMVADTIGDSFLAKPRKYSCYELLRKAFLTIDTQIIDNNKIGLDPIYDENGNDVGIQYPIAIDSKWMEKLGNIELNETIFENKNLWEILLQIGYYLHAIPCLKFAEDGTDRLLLYFRQLGKFEIEDNTSTKITIFNSYNLSEYFTQLDSYVTNIYSPQNEIEEWLIPKTSDSLYLISNDTAELQTKYNISEIIEFDIYNGTELRSALKNIFEYTVYSVLTGNPNVQPSKSSSIYYDIGTDKIKGFSYVPLQANQGDEPLAIQKIISSVFGSKAGNVEKIKANDYTFHIKYRTQDSLRISQIRPDLQNFMKNSSYEKYPHHEQFYGQQDKIVDSERFSANLWGRLVRIANSIYQCQEYAKVGEEKEVGDLVVIDNALYYVVSIENEYYNDAILQKVSYSKNFNQISQVVTIPSEPRFYEVSERSMVRREVRLMDFLMLSTQKNENMSNPLFINGIQWKDFIKKILFTYGGQAQLPNFAYTKFKADKIRQHKKSNDETLKISTLFPNTETQVINGIVQPKPSSEFKSVIVPILHFPLRNSIVFEWDMEDNFSANDAVIETEKEDYNTQQPVRYCDVMGRADLFSFRLFNKTDWTQAQAKRLPFAEEGDFIPTEEECQVLLSDNLSIGLDKDNREALSFNCQINLLTEDNTFITYPNLFGVKESRLRMLLLNHTVSMFEEAVDMSESAVIADNIEYSLVDSDTNSIELKITKPANIDLKQVKAIVMYDTDKYGLRYSYLAKNVADHTTEEKLKSWWIYPVFNN